jgi:signal transduction histidine kinase
MTTARASTPTLARFIGWITSLKGRLSLAIVAGVLSAVAVAFVAQGVGAGWPLASAVGVAVALAIVLLLARGTTSPLRRLASAARRLEAGDFSTRVETSRISEIALLERAFNDMAAELAQVDRFRKDLVANASHELRTPISVLRASLENMVDGVEEPSADRLRVLLGQVVRLNRLTDQLLDLSLLESGTVPFAPLPFPARPVLRHTAEALAIRGEARGVTFSIEGDGDPWIFGDEQRIEQVVTNLCENALRHAPDATTVTLRADQDKLDATVRLTISDLGPGIDPDEAARVFDRFHRVDPARPSADGGAGLGLAIVRWVVDLHGGSIAVEPNPLAQGRRGCTMVVRLPSADQPAHSVAAS